VGVLLIGALPPPTGGVATHLLGLERALRACGVAVQTVDPRRHGPDGRDGRPRLLARLAAAALRGDLVHVHTNGHNRGSWALAALSSIGHTAGRATLLTLHSGLAPAFMRKSRTAVRKICARYTFVIAVNPEIAQALRDAGHPASRIVVAPAFSPAGLSFRLAPPGLAQLRRRHPLLLASTVVAGASEYGADVLLDAFARVHRLHDAAGLLIYGPGTQAPSFAAEVRARGLEGAVHLLGELDRPRALAVVAACDLFVRPTRADGDAISVREALALGRPVLASTVGARPPAAHLFAAGSSAACAEQIFQIIGNPAAPCVRETTPPDDCLPTLLALYRRLGLRFSTESTSARLAATNGTPLAMAP